MPCYCVTQETTWPGWLALRLMPWAFLLKLNCRTARNG